MSAKFETLLLLQSLSFSTKLLLRTRDGGLFCNFEILSLTKVVKIFFTMYSMGNSNISISFSQSETKWSRYMDIFDLEHIKVTLGSFVAFSQNWTVTRKRIIVERNRTKIWVSGVYELCTWLLETSSMPRLFWG